MATSSLGIAHIVISFLHMPGDLNLSSGPVFGVHYRLSGLHSGIAIEFPGVNGEQWDIAGLFGVDFMVNVGLGKATLSLGYDVGSICNLANTSLEFSTLIGLGEFGASFDPNSDNLQGGHIGIGLAPGNVIKFIRSLVKGNSLAKAYVNNMISVGGSKNLKLGSYKRGLLE